MQKNQKHEIENVSQMGQVNDITKKIKSMERNLENWPHALLIERHPQIALTDVIAFGSTPANA